MDRRLTSLALIGGLALVLANGAARAAERDWRRVVTEGDRARLRGWRGSWVSALRQVGESPSAAQMRAQGLLFDPDRVLSGAVPPAGTYRCRVFKLGGRDPAAPEYAVSVWGRCTLLPVEAGLGFVRESGAQRPVGVIFPDTDARGIFLGATMIGDETRARSYGRDESRNLAGLVERVGEARWRMVLPEPRFGSTLDVIELVPMP